MWTDKYRPDDISKMVGNEETRTKVVSWLKKWKPGAKAALLVGPPGTGKTTLVHLLAARSGLNLVELNASDTRTKTGLTKKIGQLLTNTSLLGERSLIFLDEVDGLSGRSDYGAVEFIKDSVKASENPVVMAANDPDADQVKKLADVAVLFKIRPPPPREVQVYLRMVAEGEGLSVTDEKLFEIVKSARGDLRYALNSLQSGASDFKDSEMTASQAINEFFEAPDPRAAARALRGHPGQPREKLRDVFGSIMKARLSPQKRARALEVVSRADLLIGRMTRGRDWRLLRYFDSTLAYGLDEALSGEKLQYAQDFPPWPLQLRIWNDSKKIKEIGRLAARRLGISQKGCLVEDFPYMMVLCGSKKFREELVATLNLDEPFENFVVKESARSRR